MLELKITLSAPTFALPLLTSVPKKHHVAEYQDLRECAMDDLTFRLIIGEKLCALTLKESDRHYNEKGHHDQRHDELQFNEDHTDWVFDVVKKGSSERFYSTSVAQKLCKCYSHFYYSENAFYF